jgi:hypothetical protein
MADVDYQFKIGDRVCCRDNRIGVVTHCCLIDGQPSYFVKGVSWTGWGGASWYFQSELRAPARRPDPCWIWSLPQGWSTAKGNQCDQ